MKARKWKRKRRVVNTPFIDLSDMSWAEIQFFWEEYLAEDDNICLTRMNHKRAFETRNAELLASYLTLTKVLMSLPEKFKDRMKGMNKNRDLFEVIVVKKRSISQLERLYLKHGENPFYLYEYRTILGETNSESFKGLVAHGFVQPFETTRKQAQVTFLGVRYLRYLRYKGKK